MFSSATEHWGLRPVDTQDIDFDKGRSILFRRVEKYGLSDQERVYAGFRYISNSK